MTVDIFKKSLTLSFFELKARNHNTYLGFVWYFLQPLFMFLVLYYVKRNLIGLHIENFIPYLFIGVIMVHFFISSTMQVSGSITKHYELLNSKKLNPEIFVLSNFFVSLWHHIFETILVLLILMFFGYYHGIFYFLILPLYSLFIFGLGKILCVLSTRFFDITYVWNYFCQILWFILPIYYSVSDENWLVKLNPIYYFLKLGRYLVYDFKSVSIDLILICLVISLGTFLVGKIIFDFRKDVISERIK